MKKWYVVYRDKVPGVYDKREQCSEQVTKFSGGCYKGYKSQEEADASWMNHLRAGEKKKIKPKILIVVPFLLTVIAFLIAVTLLDRILGDHHFTCNSNV
jgi:hypothetical protein